MNVKQTLLNSILAGISIGMAGITYLSIDNHYIGSCLFSLGLFTIIQFRFDLFTGKVGYIPLQSRKYLVRLLLILIGNLIGTFLVSFLVRITRISELIQSKSVSIVNTKSDDSIVSIIILSAFCGVLMYIAVENAGRSSDITKVFGITFPVMTFILCGFHHSIADSFYVFSAGISIRSMGYLLLVIAGNTIGAVIIPLLTKRNHADVV